MATKSSRTKTYSVDFAKEHGESTNVYSKSKSLYPSAYFEPSSDIFTDPSFIPVNMIYVKNATYVHLASNKVYCINGKNANKQSINGYSYYPAIIPIQHNGKNTVLILAGDKGEIFAEQTLTLNFSNYKNAVLHQEILFTANDNVVYFSNKWKRENLEEDIKLVNFITIDKGYGEIIKLVSGVEKLYIVTKNAVLKLSIKPDLIDYTLEPVITDGIMVDENSVCSQGDNLYFVSKGKFCCYNGKTLKQQDFIEEGTEYYAPSQAGLDKGHYMFVYAKYPEYVNLCRCIEILTGYNSFLEVQIVSQEGGKGYYQEYGFFGDFNIATQFMDYSCSYKTKAMDLGSAKTKRLVGVEGSFSYGSIILSGDFGSQTFYFKGQNSFECNLCSKAFTITLETFNYKLPLSNLKLKYQIKGE